MWNLSAVETRSRPLIYLVTPAGVPNYGDELIVSAWLRYLARTAPDAEVWVDTHSPGIASVMLSPLHPRVRFTDTLWRLCERAQSDDPWQVSSWVRRAVNNIAMAPQCHYGIELLRSADVVHLVGGGYINTIWSRNVGLLAGVVAAVERSGGRAVMTGQGLVPSGDAAPLLRSLADRFDVVDVRDNPSAELLGVAPGVDDAFLGLEPDICASEEPPEVMLCLQSDLVEVGLPAVAGAALSMLREWKIAPHDVGIVEGIPGPDYAVYEMIEHELPGARFYPFADIWRDGLPVSPLQVWISTRFHMHLVAAAVGASGVALSIRPDYYGVKHGALTSLGSGWTLLDDLTQVPPQPMSGGFAPEVADRYQNVKLELADSIYQDVVNRTYEVEQRGPRIA